MHEINIIASFEIDSIQRASQALADQPDRVWVVFIFLVLGGCTLAVIRWLLHQLDLQRSAYLEAQHQLLDHLSRERSSVLVRLGENSSLMGEVVKLLETLEQEQRNRLLIEAARKNP